MSVYVVRLTRGLMLGWNRHPVPPEGTAKGWRPYVWTRDLTDAEKFASRGAAAEFAGAAMPHDHWSVLPIAGGEEDGA